MKTTVELPDTLYEEARALAQRRGWTVKVILEESLREFLEKQRQIGKPFVPRNVTFRGEGLQDPGMSFADMLETAGRGFPGTE